MENHKLIDQARLNDAKMNNTAGVSIWMKMNILTIRHKSTGASDL